MNRASLIFRVASMGSLGFIPPATPLRQLIASYLACLLELAFAF